MIQHKVILLLEVTGLCFGIHQHFQTAEHLEFIWHAQRCIGLLLFIAYLSLCEAFVKTQNCVP